MWFVKVNWIILRELPLKHAVRRDSLILKQRILVKVSVLKCVLCCASVQFSSVTHSCLTLCHPMNRSTPGLPVHHQLPEFTQTHVHQTHDHPIMSSSVVPFSSCPQSLPASESFPMSQLFASGGQSIGVSVLALVRPMNTQD